MSRDTNDKLRFPSDDSFGNDPLADDPLGEDQIRDSIPLPADLGPFRLDRVIGQGGMGEVFLAYDSRLERKVAIKKIRNEAALDTVNRQRLLREAKIGAKLSHPAIVQVFDIVELAGFHWIVMELVEGTTVAQMVRSGPLEVSIALSIARQVAEGLAEAHDKGLLHRDLKSENVMVGAKNRVKILDFGLAKPVDANKDSSLTADGEVMGTCRSMSPEQAKGLDLDGRSDLFSLGVLLYEMTTGISPFRAPTPVATLTLVCTHDPEAVALLNPAVSFAISNFITRLIDKDRSGRPASAAEAAAEISTLEAQLSATFRLPPDRMPTPPPEPFADEPTFGQGLPKVSSVVAPAGRRTWPPAGAVGAAVGGATFGGAVRGRPPGAPKKVLVAIGLTLFLVLAALVFYYGFAG